MKRDKASLDIFWLKDDSLEDSANLPAPDVIAAEIVEDLQASARHESALICFRPASAHIGATLERETLSTPSKTQLRHNSLHKKQECRGRI